MSVQFYDDNAEHFFNATVNANMHDLYAFFLNQLTAKTGEILDVGCGSGRDAKYFMEQGFTVTALDLSSELAKKATQFIGQEVLVADMRTLNYVDQFIGIWACASLLHLTEEDILTTLNRCYIALKKGGVMYTSFKYREKNYEKEGRRFTCFTEEKLCSLIKQTPFSINEILKTVDVRPNRENEEWLNVLLIKESF